MGLGANLSLPPAQPDCLSLCRRTSYAFLRWLQACCKYFARAFERQEPRRSMAEVTKVTSKFRHFALGCVILAATWSFAGPRKISQDLQKQSSTQWVNVIVQYKASPNRAEFDRVFARGGSLQLSLPSINAAAFTV